MKTKFLILILMLSNVFLYATNYTAKALINKDTAFVGDVLILNIILNSKADMEEFSIASDDKWSVKKVKDFSKQEGTEDTYVAAYQFVPIVSGDLQIAAFSIKNTEGDNFITNQLSLKIEEPKASEDMILEVSYSPKKVYIGQVIDINYKWKSLHSLNSIKSVNVTIPSFDDENFESFTNPNYIVSDDKNAIGLPVHNQRLVGKAEILKFDEKRNAYSVTFSTLAIPQNAGKFVFKAPSIVCAVPKNKDVSAGVDPSITVKRFLYPAYFDNEFFNYQTDVSTLKKQFVIAEDLEVEVFPLPTKSMPKNFSYIIGEYALSISVADTNLRVGDTLELIVTVSALNGSSLFNVKLDEDNFTENGFDKFEFPKEISGEINGNKKTFKVPLLVRSIESTKIPSLHFNFFNPSLEKYRNIKTKEIELKVSPSQSARILAEDGSEILIKTKLTKNAAGIYDTEVDKGFFIAKEESFIGGMSLLKFSLFVFIAPLIFIIAFLIKFIKKLILNSTRLRNKIAFSLKLKSIALKSEVSANDIEEIVIEVFSIYLNTEKTAISFVEIKGFLESNNCPENLVKELAEIFDKIRLRYYSKAKENKANKELLKQTITLVKKINRNLK